MSHAPHPHSPNCGSAERFSIGVKHGEAEAIAERLERWGIDDVTIQYGHGSVTIVGPQWFTSLVLTTRIAVGEDHRREDPGVTAKVLTVLFSRSECKPAALDAVCRLGGPNALRTFVEAALNEVKADIRARVPTVKVSRRVQ